VEARPEVRYTQSGDLSIAYFVHGDGPIDIVYVPGFISNADLIWEVPFYRHMIERLAAFGRVITFDKRGTGLSDRTFGHGSIADRVDDIRAVMDAAGTHEAAIVGLSEGGPLSIAFTASSPDRVRALVVWSSFAAIMRSDDFPIGVDPDVLYANIDLAAELWGQGLTVRQFVANIPDDVETQALVARYERASATPALVREILRRNVEIDVRGALPAISAPTLVVHRTGDPIVPIALGRYVGDHIPGAQWLELAGGFHVDGSPGGERDSLEAIETFLTGSPRPAEVDRVLATVLFTDIVDSTRRAAELGDRRWREVLDAHDAVVRRELDRYGGREVKTTGDGFLAVFDGPARAVQCAQAIVRGARAFGVEVRAGLHTGETEVRGDDVAGMAVHIGARVLGHAGAGEVVVTSTVRDLVIGSVIEFEDRGRHQLKGVPGEWQLLAVVPG
jgi:class 3 adenylate cyclase/pimeloyl-ACP methyl ester carboxylesterase